MKNRCCNVSVPLRGFCFSTSGRASTVIRAYGTGFRPLTGILFFNIWPYQYSREEDSGFPSPYGDFVFQQRRRQTQNGCRRSRGFRPLTGILFFNEDAKLDKRAAYVSFRPLTGILFFN